ncbi:hypothetical protein HRW07_06625 [Streptomyces lunaelactis]|nr:hypothetical protein [Streptomyces lunaelactis]NUL02920.1 hypothetical protein [Streptomyces lunaelactis]
MRAALSMLGDQLTFPSALDAPYGLLVLVAWGAGPALLAHRFFARRDV